MYEQAKKITYTVLLKLSLFFPAFILCLLAVFSLIMQPNINLTLGERTVYTINNFVFYLGILGMFFFLAYMQYFIKKVNEQTLILVCTITYLFLGLFLILGSYESIRADANSVFQAALQMNAGDFSSLEKTEYLGIYPFQLGLVTYERLLVLITSSPRILFVTNLLFVIGINYMIWQMTIFMQIKNVTTRKWIILVSFLFLPQLFFILFGYGTIPGFFFFISAYFFSIKFMQSNKYRFFLFSLVAITLSCLLKNNFTIGAIALACVYLLYFLKSKSTFLLLAALFIMTIPSFSATLLVNIYSQATNMEISPGLPKILWVTMGLQDDPKTSREGGWYNNYTRKTYSKSQFDANQASKVGKEDLNELLENFGEDPGYAINFFARKIASTWLEPSYQSIWSGPIVGVNTDPIGIIDSIYSGGVFYKIIISIMHLSILFIFCFSSYYYFLCLKKFNSINLFVLLPGIYFIGGFLFHLAWETKSQYVYTYVFLLIIPACLGFMDVYDKIKNRAVFRSIIGKIAD